MSQMLAFVIVVLILFIGDVIATRTKAWVPSVFVCAILFLFGYWTFFPSNIVEITGILPIVATLLMYLLITNMGTLLSVRELMNQWKTILIAISGILGIVALLFTIGTLLFDFKTVVIVVPPLVGGIVSSLIMSEAAKAAGLMSLSIIAILIYVMQGFAGYPLTSIMLKKEGSRILSKYRSGEWSPPNEAAQTDGSDNHDIPWMFRKIPDKYNTSYFKFLRLGLVSFLAYGLSVLINPFLTISPFVLCLLFGIIATSIGFLERQPLQKANGFGFTIMGLMLFIFDGLKNATPEMLLDLLWPMFGTIIIGVIGMYIFSFIVGKTLGVSKELAFAVSLTALYGFPADYIITNEVINSLTTDPKERDALTSHMLPPMLVAGFITVTIVSVILAGILVGLI
ncbi:hypothetical protein [Listeria innocua]|uniref:hypothetical protein n=1 Tax=Listeria innocua TaxID=1642 RepID=UPI001629CD4A|nr:hypothetical protein [Listeria innocua]MBC1908150.1 hypothetical protein [Listeria innocua]MBC1926006.1 hypothetical protein [Listeria innocua]MBC1929004.1 hypothetical protein [Listeria innocua]